MRVYSIWKMCFYYIIIATILCPRHLIYIYVQLSQGHSLFMKFLFYFFASKKCYDFFNPQKWAENGLLVFECVFPYPHLQLFTNVICLIVYTEKLGIHLSHIKCVCNLTVSNNMPDTNNQSSIKWKLSPFHKKLPIYI